MSGIMKLVQLGAKAAKDEIDKAAEAQVKFKKVLEEGSSVDLIEDDQGHQVAIHMDRAAQWQIAVNEALDSI